MTTHRLRWRTPDGKEHEHATPLAEATARASAEALNRAFPETPHWIEPVPEQEPAA